MSRFPLPVFGGQTVLAAVAVPVVLLIEKLGSRPMPKVKISVKSLPLGWSQYSRRWRQVS